MRKWLNRINSENPRETWNYEYMYNVIRAVVLFIEQEKDVSAPNFAN